MRIIVSLILMLIISVAAFGVTKTIYEIQYTTVPGSGNYPSLLVGQVVTTQGIVTGIGFTGGKYVIAEDSGLWKAVFVNNPTNTPQPGDKVEVTGTVAEVSGFTEINTITAYNVISSGNPLPAATPVVPGNLLYNTGEPYEGVLIKLSNVHVSVSPIGGQFSVTDNINNCIVNDGFFPQPHSWSSIVLNQVWTEINGIVNYSSGQYKVNPRNDADMIPLADINTISLKVDEVEAKKGETKAVNVLVSKLEESWGLTKYTFKVGFNKRILSFVDVDIASTLSASLPDLVLSPQEDSITVTYQGTTPIVSDVNNGVLIKLLFKTNSYGESVLDLTGGIFNDTLTASLLNDGKISIPIKKRLAWLSIYNDDYNKKNIFNPWLYQKITIEYGSLLNPGITTCKAIIRIYDVQGRLVATPINLNMSNSIEHFEWNGRDRNGNLLPIGVYYCHLEIIDRVNGKSETTTQPIVVAAELK
jgi:hypothetical protein